VNYGLEAYARAVVGALAEICTARDLPQPDIVIESGRAMTAHHAVLITNVIDMEATPVARAETAADDAAHPLLRRFVRGLDDLELRSPVETYQDARQLLDEARGMFEEGALDLACRARAEELFYATCRSLKKRLGPEIRSQRETLDQVNMALADKLYCNFSLFQSVPDVWAIEQIFPIVPLQRLDERPDRRAVIHDLTCDSDGSIALYVDQDGVEHSLPIHALEQGETYLLGIFMLGAYQETLGDIHNLFGDTHAINLELDAQGGYRLQGAEPGDAVDELLSYVHFDPAAMLRSYRKKLDEAGICGDACGQYFAELKAGLEGYTYLEDQ
jgi:arginine decarboxylase